MMKTKQIIPIGGTVYHGNIALTRLSWGWEAARMLSDRRQSGRGETQKGAIAAMRAN